MISGVLPIKALFPFLNVLPQRSKLIETYRAISEQKVTTAIILMMKYRHRFFSVDVEAGSNNTFIRL